MILDQDQPRYEADAGQEHQATPQGEPGTLEAPAVQRAAAETAAVLKHKAPLKKRSKGLPATEHPDERNAAVAKTIVFGLAAIAASLVLLLAALLVDRPDGVEQARRSDISQTQAPSATPDVPAQGPAHDAVYETLNYSGSPHADPANRKRAAPPQPTPEAAADLSDGVAVEPVKWF